LAHRATIQGTKSNVLLVRPPTLEDDIEKEVLTDLTSIFRNSKNKPKEVVLTKSGLLVVRMQHPLTDDNKSLVKDTVTATTEIPPDKVAICNRKTHLMVKFMLVLKTVPDRKPWTPASTLETIKEHPEWRNISFTVPPILIPTRGDKFMHIVLCKIDDDHNGSNAKHLTRTTIHFGPEL